MEATGWQQHTVRGFVSILGRKGGLMIESSKNSAGGTYQEIDLPSIRPRRLGPPEAAFVLCSDWRRF